MPRKAETDLEVLDTVDWEPYADGDTYDFVQGTDFNVDIDEFRNRAYSAAARRGMRARTQAGITTDADGAEVRVLSVRFFTPEEAKAPPPPTPMMVDE